MVSITSGIRLGSFIFRDLLSLRIIKLLCERIIKKHIGVAPMGAKIVPFLISFCKMSKMNNWCGLCIAG